MGFSKFKRKAERILKTPVYIAMIPKIISRPTYYPELERKSRSEMWWDNFKWIMKHHEQLNCYTSYGMDIKGLRNPDDYLSTSEFWDFIREGNRTNVRSPYGQYNSLILLRDKYVFSAQITGTVGPHAVPKTLAMIDRGHVFIPDRNEWLEFADFCQTDLKGVFKIVDGTFGDNVFPGEIRNGAIFANGRQYTPEEMLESFGKKRYIIQELVEQHPALQAFGTKCVNTIRTITIMGNSGKVSVFAAFLRVGTDTESFVDNRAKGGLAIGVELETGKLMRYGLPHARFGEKVEVHPLSGIVFDGFQLPCWDEITELVCSAHKQFPNLRSIGWDVAIRADGPVLLEGNDSWEISGPQDTYGGLKKRLHELINQ